MSILGWLKAVLLTALLLIAAYFFGTVCKQMRLAHEYLLFPSRELLNLLLRLLAGMGLMAVTAGTAAALLRPLWLAWMASVVSALALLLGWGVLSGSRILVLLYLLAALSYAAITQFELSRRVDFSVRAVAQYQPILLVVLLVVAVGSFYLGYAAHIETLGFSIPRVYRDQVSAEAATRVSSQFPEIFREGIRDGVQTQVQSLLSEQFSKAVRPVERYIPAVAAVLLFLPLLAIIYLLGWVPAGVMGIIFLLLRALGMVRVTRQMVEVRRLVID